MPMMGMFEGITKSKFYNKCKWDLKQIRSRIDLIKKKRNAIQKYLRNDIVDLLRNDLDINAYGRAEGLLVEMTRTYCYEYVDEYCEHILKHLEAMDKSSECPEECREAASSLMFAAARFADLPELRQLRTLFSDKYGKSLDYYLSKQFSEKAKSGLPSKEAKLQLLHDIAQECGLEWNSKALENNLFNASVKSMEIKNRDHESIRLEEGEEEKPHLKFNLIPPPYTKSEEDRNGKTVKSVRARREDKINKAVEGQRILKVLNRDDGEQVMVKEKNAPGRASSLPAQPSSPKDDRKGHNRASSLRSNLDENANVHVHPRLPDYDDFVARLTALREDGRH